MMWFWKYAWFWFALSLPAAAQVSRREPVRDVEGFSISAQSVRNAAAEFAPAVKWPDAYVVFSAKPATRTANAPLRVTEMRAGRDPRSVLLRVECRNVRDCAPFWAEMVFSHPVDRALAPHSRDNAPSTILTSAPSIPPIVRPGRPAALLCEQNGLRISMRVVPLKRAAMGETVKVLDPESHRKFLAQVVGVDFLRSDLREAK